MRPDDRVVHRLYRLLDRQPSAQTSPAMQKEPPVTAREEKLRLSQDVHRIQEAAYDAEGAYTTKQRSSRTYFSLAVLSALGLSLFYLFARSPHFSPCGASVAFPVEDVDGVCPQADAITPQLHSSLLNALEAEYSTKVFKLKAYESLGGAIRVPYVFATRLIGTSPLLTPVFSTVAYDDLADPGKDERWEIFGELHAYLAKRFPLVSVDIRNLVRQPFS